MEENSSNIQQSKLLVNMLKQIAKNKGITQEMIAEKTGMKQSNIARIFSHKYSPTLQNFIAIAKAVEVNIFIEDKDSDTDLNKLFEQAMTELGRRPDKLPKN